MVLSAGTRLGPYEVVGLIGAGAMGEVYRAVDAKLKREVALKIVSGTLAGDADCLARFQREGEVLASISHPNVGAIHGLEECQGIGALVMELVEGPTLADRVRDGALPEGEALEIGRQIAAALEAAHARGVIHRDLKPANVKVRPDGTVKVLDFGLAKVLCGNSIQVAGTAATTISTPGMTRAGVLLGTPAYLSPEQAKGKPVDTRTDIWALGCVLYEMLTGRSPFAEETVSETLARILERDPDWTALPANTSPDVRRLLRRCLEKEPSRRLHSAADVRIAIEDASASGRAQTVANASPGKASTFVAWVIAAAAAVGAVTVWWTAPRRTSDVPAVVRLDVTTPPTRDVSSFALSPDGRSIVFVALNKEVPQLFLRSLDETEPRLLLETEGATDAFWAPDSRSIGFFAGGLLKRLDLAGGRPQVLAQARNPSGGAWGHDDVILYAPSAASPLMRVGAGGGQPARVTELASGELSHRFPSFLPDGRRFVFTVATSAPKDGGLYLGSMDAPTRRQWLMAGESGGEWLPAGYLVTMRDRALVAIRFDLAATKVIGDAITLAPRVATAQGSSAFSTSASGLVAYRTGDAPPQRKLAWFDRHGNVLATVSAAGFLASTRDGQHIALSRRTQSSTLLNTDIWLLDTAGGVPRRFTFDPASEISPVWSPEGDRLVFASNRNGGVFDLFEKPASFARDERLLLATPTNKFPNDWSPDGKVLLFVNEDAATGDDLWTMSLEEPRKVTRLLSGNYADSQGQFSPDGHWLAYRSNESGQWEVYLRPFPGPGSQQLVSRGGGIQPRWRADGKELFYVAADGRMTAVSIRQISNGQAVQIGAPAPLFTAHLGDSSNQQFEYVVDPAGRRFLIDVADDQTTATPITIVQNLTAILPK